MKIMNSKNPVPPKRTGAKSKYPFEKMKPGQFLILTLKPEADINAVRSSVLTTARSRGFKVQTASETFIIAGQPVVRKLKVWLIEECQKG